MKQKIIIKVQMACYKCRTKALKITAGASGVVSVTAQGDEHLLVTGKCVDPVALTATLRKKVGVAILISVEELKEPKKEVPPPPKGEKEATPAGDKDKDKEKKDGGGDKSANGKEKAKENKKEKAEKEKAEKENASMPPQAAPCSYGYGMPPPYGCGPCPPPNYYNHPQPQYCMYEIPPPDPNPPCSIM